MPPFLTYFTARHTTLHTTQGTAHHGTRCKHMTHTKAQPAHNFAYNTKAHHFEYNISPSLLIQPIQLHPHLLRHICFSHYNALTMDQPFQHWTNFVKLDRANLALLRRVLERPSSHLPRLLPRYQKCLLISVFWSVTKVLIVFVDSCTKVDFIFLVRAVSLLMVLLR